MENLNLLDRFNHWMKESITIKLLSIGFLMLILLIPSAWISDLIAERQQRAENVMAEVSSKWSGSQTLGGPVLIIPYKVYENEYVDKDHIEIVEKIQKAYFLPEKLSVKATVNPEVLHRGIFDAVVYESDLKVEAEFLTPDFKSLKIEDKNIVWTEAHMVYGISDLRGISENPKFSIKGSDLVSEPTTETGIRLGEYFNGDAISDIDNDPAPVRNSTQGIVAGLNWTTEADFDQSVSLILKLKGSGRLYFAPVGKTTEVDLSGPWANPSFDGEFLPVTRQVQEAGFNASWKILHFNRPFDQKWTDKEHSLKGFDFGVKLLIPADQYQKSMRTAKYGQLIILLTFLSMFLVEIMRKVRIHPFQYVLIGAALIIYYSLLLSLAEQVGYNFSYLIASLATLVLISLYMRSVLPGVRMVYTFGTLLAFFYGFIFTLIQLQDFSLLLGNIGLFVILAALMYFSRNIRWYGETSKT